MKYQGQNFWHQICLILLCSDDYSGKFWAHKKILILLYQELNWNSPSVPHDSFIDTQNFMQLVSMDISMKNISLHTIGRP